MVKALPLILMLGLLASCTSTQRSETMDEMPDDFALVVSVLAEPVAELPRAPAQPSRYMVLPDGTLRYDVDRIGAPGRVWLPPVVRTLSRRQLDEIWSIMKQIGLIEQESASQPMNLRLVPPPDHELVYLVDITAGQRRWDIVRRTPLESGPDPALARLVDHLAALAWVDERKPMRPREMPKRYDFGPDPYERYRPGGKAK